MLARTSSILAVNAESTVQQTLHVHGTTPHLVEEKAPHVNAYMSSREQKPWSWISMRHNAKNDCAGRSQQQFTLPTDRQTCFSFWRLNF
jgi:hypothetical protein